MNSTEIINIIKKRYEELKDKDFDYKSFYAGMLEGLTFQQSKESK